MFGLNEHQGYCPYCGESITLLVDGSVEDSTYTEDCSVCCQPILVHAVMGVDGELQSLQLQREDETG
ncbi:MAG TPA: CPXCG motif-containing cysteine-rich protein [Xanthomonadales bacterium]|nr:CPXCG motif-containing cysteine-rich protein [Xanthomonadales bacterium]